jgi:hypothetical protein
MIRVYISGPMTGLPAVNFPAFHAEAARLRALGFHVEIPAENSAPPRGTWKGWMRLSIAQIVTCDRVHMLPGWEGSRGAVIEHRLAKDIGIEVTYAT